MDVHLGIDYFEINLPVKLITTSDKQSLISKEIKYQLFSYFRRSKTLYMSYDSWQFCKKEHQQLYIKTHVIPS